MKKATDDDAIDWSDDGEPAPGAPHESTLWGETRINEAIHEANQQQRDPEQFIKEQKAGRPSQASEETQFRTLYQKPNNSLWQRVRSWFTSSS